MFYPTQHHTLFSPLNTLPFLPSSSSSSAAAASPSLQALMECEELKALKRFIRPEAALRMIRRGGYEFPAAVADAQCGGGESGDDFCVDELLDFSNGDGDEEEEDDKKKKVDTPISAVTSYSVSPENEEKLAVAVAFPATADFASLTGGEISSPAEDLDCLEWLSHFVEDSFSGGYSLSYPAGKLPPVQGKPGSTPPVQTKSRTKRSRTGVRVWPAASPSLTESSTSSSSSSSMSFPAKKKTMSVMQPFTGDGGGGAQPVRRCSHCGVQKTPQWRAGPLGSKTLCNACGVRFKSGRLLPEYRPACSPTFSSALHSNSHRKVLEMRRKKEAEETGFDPVLSF